MTGPPAGERAERPLVPFAQPRWVLPASRPDSDLVSRLSAELGLPEALCALLAGRGHSDANAAKRHLRPLLEHLHPPALLADGERAVERLLEAIDKRETIFVHGDYDVDGISAAALYTLWLRRLGGRVLPFVPHRLRDGYDFGAAGLEGAVRAGASVILTGDCGTVAHGWLAEARRRGLDVIVSDHHALGASLPPALAVVNPNRPDCPYPEKGLCGTGVAFKLCQLLGERRGVALDELLPHLDLVALATVADLVPLQGENRTLVRFGLKALARTAKPGLQALLEVTGSRSAELDAGTVGFVLAPRINAVGRMADAADGLRLLLSDDREEAGRLALLAEELNRQRQETDRRTLGEALDLLARDERAEPAYGVVLAAEGWHPGVIGIVASRVVERIHRPVVLVALDGERGRGSGRSIPGFHLHEALVACGEHLERFGGHRQAAGLDVRRDALPAFRTAFEEEARRRLQGSDLRPALKVDLELSPGGATLRLCQLLRYLGPHGIGNPRPVFLGRALELAAPPRVVGNGHVRMKLTGDGGRLDAIGFRLAERWPPAALEGGPLDVLFQLEADEYLGEPRVQAKVLDVRLSARAQPVAIQLGCAGAAPPELVVPVPAVAAPPLPVELALPVAAAATPPLPAP